MVEEFAGVTPTASQGYIYQKARGACRSISKGECEMTMPNTIAGWCTVLFFLFFGLAYFLTGMTFLSLLAAIFALGAAVFTLIGR
jgi:hypothetical protein